MHFELVDLRLLDAIAATGSLSKAAATFPVAVSAASTRLPVELTSGPAKGCSLPAASSACRRSTSCCTDTGTRRPKSPTRTAPSCTPSELSWLRQMPPRSARTRATS